MSSKGKNNTLIWFNMLCAVGMATSVFTGQLKIVIPTTFGTIVFPASNLFFAFLTFPITDIITDVLGKKEARTTVWIGFASQVITMVIIQVCLLFPGDTSALVPFAIDGWKVVTGSLIAYFAAQFWDIWIFHWIKEKITGDRHLWLRNNASTFSSQLINSTLFIGIVFGPKALLVMLPSSMLVKWIIAAADTPFVYLGRMYLRKNVDKKDIQNEKAMTER
ncbi:queuosine precursor transporter [bacterium]|nr:queuosine precursor transporter [bacterium]